MDWNAEEVHALNGKCEFCVYYLRKRVTLWGQDPFIVVNRYIWFIHFFDEFLLKYS